MTKVFKVGIAGLGTVGGGLIELLREHAPLIEKRAGCRIEIAGLAARNKSKARNFPVGSYRWYNAPIDLCRDPNIDAVVEVIGGEEGAARELAFSCLQAGKHFISANKALFAREGLALAELAEKQGLYLGYEAAVGGGIPVIKLLREGLAGNRIERIRAILNGTSNFILSQMREQKKDFSAALQTAQNLGYAEADPSFDIDGTDSAHKLLILAMLAFGFPVDREKLHLEGIEQLTSIDIDAAERFGWRVKLLALAEREEDTIILSVYPAMVPLSSLLAHVEGADNAVEITGDYSGPITIKGQGAGAKPTASALLGDLIDAARGVVGSPFSIKVEDFVATGQRRLREGHAKRFYCRLLVRDKPGVMAAVSLVFTELAISLESILQQGRALQETVDIILVTHPTHEAKMRAALEKLKILESCLAAPMLIRIEES